MHELIIAVCKPEILQRLRTNLSLNITTKEPKNIFQSVGFISLLNVWSQYVSSMMYILSAKVNKEVKQRCSQATS